VRLLERTVNGQPGLIAQQDGVTVAVYAFDFAGDQITRIWAVLNPAKLRPWATTTTPSHAIGRGQPPPPDPGLR